MAHIFKKCLKTIEPPPAYGNTASTIVSVLWVVGIPAPLFHVNPGIKLRSFTKAMSSDIRYEHFTTETTARLGRTVNEIAPVYRFNCPALTSTHPSRKLVCFVTKRDHGESSVLLADHIHSHNVSQQHTIIHTRSAVKVDHA